ncbi:transferase hexapeptide repeat containing protein [Candidatus Scalindua japonica]|uniref:Transferase hexapeptide repeat containing protein n=1 Tax=Candidatus Scalindua japonica TaxID=1284222 RepID=A0A286U199_9BACT|nr:Gfo/Idh/MocA family oxidoreductase [Candidatus Scalindua japonica]GAX61886.1 transferase hexapeptide repeat containing protein [Candidatus Scalindua japonica]
MKKNIAVVGAGYWGKNLVRNFYELNALRTICDADIDLVNSYESQFPGIKFTNSFDALLSDPSIEAIVIATPAEYHYQMAKKAIRHKKHVFVEKPLALQLEQGEELISLANQQGLILMVGHILHYHPAIQKLKELIDRGELGKIQYIYSNRLNMGKIRSEENILWSFAPHDISVILLLLQNELPETVYSTGGNYLQKQISDVTMTTMDFRSGVKAHIFVSWLHPFKEQKLVVVGDKKMAVFDDVSTEKLSLFPHRIDWVDRLPVACKAEAEVVSIGSDEPLKTECKHFLKCIEENQIPKTDGNEGLRVLRVLQISQKSLSKNGEKIILDKDGKLRKPATEKHFIHESSYVDNGCDIGANTQIWHFSHILRDSKIGEKCTIGQNVLIGPEVTIGDKCKVQNNVSIYKGVTLEDGVFCGPSCVFTNVYNPRAFVERKHEFMETLVKRGATIGANATIVCGVTIGKYSLIGAGSVVKCDVADYAVVAGVPAKQIGWVCKCGTTLKFNDERTVCGYCGDKYSLKGNKLEVN